MSLHETRRASFTALKFKVLVMLEFRRRRVNLQFPSEGRFRSKLDLGIFDTTRLTHACDRIHSIDRFIIVIIIFMNLKNPPDSAVYATRPLQGEQLSVSWSTREWGTFSSIGTDTAKFGVLGTCLGDCGRPLMSLTWPAFKILMVVRGSMGDQNILPVEAPHDKASESHRNEVRYAPDSRVCRSPSDTWTLRPCHFGKPRAHADISAYSRWRVSVNRPGNLRISRRNPYIEE